MNYFIRIKRVHPVFEIMIPLRKLTNYQRQSQEKTPAGPNGKIRLNEQTICVII